jgi:O-Antigen ligase
MFAWRLRAEGLDRREFRITAFAAAVAALAALAGVHKLGTAGLLAPVAVGLVVVLVSNSLAMTAFVVGIVVLCEGASFGLFKFTASLYSHATVLNVLVALVVVSVGLDLLRRRESLWLPGALLLPLLILALAMVAGIATGHGAGVSLSTTLHKENVLAYLLVLPIAVANLRLDRRQVSLLLCGVFALALVKAFLGLAEIGSGHGVSIEGSSSLTYYEPTANWLIMIALLGVVAALVARVRVPLWMLLGSPLLIGSLLLSYRRSFWIATALCLLLVVLLALSPSGRRLLVPTALLVALAISLLGSTHFQSAQSPLLKRAASLTPSSLTENVEDRYRLDERANVLGDVLKHPITGLGIQVPWRATSRGLPIEHGAEARQYVHFAALWFWMKLGMLGLIAYISLLTGAAVLAWRVWRGGSEPLPRAFGLASLCGFAGLVVIETTATFTAADARFTVLLAAQIGLLALLTRRRDSEEPAEELPSAARS